MKASDAELELAKRLFENQHKVHIEDWKMYIGGVEIDNDISFDDESKLEVFKQVFLNVEGHESTFPDYRLNKKTDLNK